MADVIIDGSYGEGGGQVLRTCLSLAALTGRSVEIESIRAGRSKPGLQPQHLTAVHAAASICAARVDGDRVGSTRLVFAPQAEVQSGSYRFDIGTAGAAPLVMQTIAVPLATASEASRITVTGGTHVPHAPPAEYLEEVYAPALARVGMDLNLDMARAGFYPRGGGEVMALIRPGLPARPFDLAERGRLSSLSVTIVTSNLREDVAERGARVVRRALRSVKSVEPVLRPMPSISTGAAVVIVAECEGGFGGFTALGERGKPMERVAEEACDAFSAWWASGTACDERLSDQLVLPAALAPGESIWTAPRLTMHLRTVLWVVERFLPITSSVEDRADGSSLVRLRGAKMN